MKVLISSGLFHPSKLGGPSKTLYWLAKGLISDGVNVSVVTSNSFIEDDTIEFDTWLNVDKIRVRYCTTKSKFNHSVAWHSIIESRYCNIVLLSSIFYIPSFLMALFVVFTKKKVIWSPRGELFDSAISGSTIKKLYIRVLKKLFAKRVIFHATSLDEEIMIKKYFGNNVKTAIIPNYMELPLQQQRKVINDNYFLFVGRIAPIKALDNLLLGLVKSKLFVSSDYKLLIAGGVEKQFEEYNEQLQQILENNKLLREKVIFLGNIEGNEKYQLFANAYFSILVSHSENFGNVVIEALTQGTPVITSQGTPWQQLAERKAGFWIRNDKGDIAKCIDEVISMSNEEYLQFRKNALDFAKEFNIYENINKWIKVIQ